MSRRITEIATSRPLAKVAHLCTICGRPIAIGTTYTRHFVRDADSLDPAKSTLVFKLHHGRCPEARHD